MPEFPAAHKRLRALPRPQNIPRSRTTTIPCSENQPVLAVVGPHDYGGSQRFEVKRHRHITSQPNPRRRGAHFLPHCSSPASPTAKPLTFVVYGSPTRHDGPCNRVRTSTTPPRPSVLRECVGCVGSAAEGCVAVGVTGYRPADAATINHTLNGCVRARGIVCVSAGGFEARSSGAVLRGCLKGFGPSARGDALLTSWVEG